MSAISEFFLGSAPYVQQLQLIEISHPNFSQTYRVVRNDTRGVVVTHEGPAGPFTYSYYPLRIKPVGSGNDLDQKLEVTLGDLGEIIPGELDLVDAANGMETKPTLKYREYRSDDLTAPMYGPLTFDIDALTSTVEGSALRASATAFNRGRIGTYYTTVIFPMILNA